MSPQPARDDLLPRLAALAATLVVMGLMVALLLAPPQGRYRALVERPLERLRLVFVARAPATPELPPVEEPAQPPPTPAAPAAQAPRQAEAGGGEGPDPILPPARLHDDSGRVLLPADDAWARATRRPPGAAPPPGPPRDPMERKNPVDYRGTRFGKDWTSDGDLADVTRQELVRAQKKVAEFLLGQDIQHAQARPSPEVRFNPARHERPADLGSEATGDAWRAAPISYEPAPGLDGRASRRIREQIAELEAATQGCDAARVRRLLAPALQALENLQRAEYAWARGADPIRRAHELPNAANSAWDQARRALWYAGRQLSGCRR
ncbi:MAG: hypothetical protein C0P65_005080 [Lysobacteraceae bacterium]|nr:hypothetical protein [Xanthomonadaceae bacterium]